MRSVQALTHPINAPYLLFNGTAHMVTADGLTAGFDRHVVGFRATDPPADRLLT